MHRVSCFQRMIITYQCVRNLQMIQKTKLKNVVAIIDVFGRDNNIYFLFV